MDGSTVFINREGKVQFTLDRDFRAASPFLDGMSQVENRTQPGEPDKVGYIDRTGKPVIPPAYDRASAFRDGIAGVCVCGQTGYIDKAGGPVWGVRLRASSVQPEAAPSPSAVTPLLVEKLTDHPDPLTLKVSSGSGACGPWGKQIWSVQVSSTDRTFPGLSINLLEGGTFLHEERIDDLNALREKVRAWSGTYLKDAGNDLKKAGIDIDALSKKLKDDAENRADEFARPIDPKGGLKGYAMLLGFGPGGSAYAASVFSPGHAYEVQVLLSLSSNSRGVKDPEQFASKIALEIRSVLFGQGQ
jgi:hypothetical protein